MIISFKCKHTEKLAGGVRVRHFVNFERIALRKLRQLQAASRLDDLMKIPPGNMLEALSHDRKGQHSIRINKQFRICFFWTKAGAEDVEIVDYH
nr:type II toxin-antitoxin system RelE/ParE family toxin [Desulfonatronovibrio magnus]